MGHGDLSPASLLKAPSGLLVFTGLQHTGPAWQVLQDITHGLQLVQALELATLLISLRGLNKLEVLEAEEVLYTSFTQPMTASSLQVMPPRSLLNRWLNQYLASYLDKPPHQVSSVQLYN